VFKDALVVFIGVTRTITIIGTTRTKRKKA